MNKDELLKIKEYALERHIPIIMDDTLEVIDKYLTEKRPEKIGNRDSSWIFCNVFF